LDECTPKSKGFLGRIFNSIRSSGKASAQASTKSDKKTVHFAKEQVTPFYKDEPASAIRRRVFGPEFDPLSAIDQEAKEADDDESVNPYMQDEDDKEADDGNDNETFNQQLQDWQERLRPSPDLSRNSGLFRQPLTPLSTLIRQSLVPTPGDFYTNKGGAKAYVWFYFGFISLSLSFTTPLPLLTLPSLPHISTFAQARLGQGNGHLGLWLRDVLFPQRRPIF